MKNQASPRVRTQSGSIFVWIFIMIALFGALSFAMTQGFRSGSSVLTKEKASLAATEIVEFLNKVKMAHDQMIIANGCTPDSISFSTTSYKRRNGSPVDDAPIPSPNPCKLYDNAGGGLRPFDGSKLTSPDRVPVSNEWLSGNFGARYMTITSLGSTENDLTYHASGFRTEVCVAVLNLVSSSNEFASVPVDNYSTGGDNSWTHGSAGGLDSVTLPTSSRIFALKTSAPENHCVIGIVLKAF